MAGMTIDITWEGIQEFKKALDEIPKNLEKENEKLSEKTLDAMKEHSPVKTGKLKAADIKSGSGYDFTLANHVKRSHGVEYSGFQEYGTRKNRPHPYLEPAINFWEDHVEQTLDKAITDSGF